MAVVFAAVVACLGTAAWLAWRSPLLNDIPRDRTACEAVDGWALERNLMEDSVRRRAEVRSSFPRRWLSAQRAYWYPPGTGPTRIWQDLAKLAGRLGMTLRRGTGAGREFEAVLLFPGRGDGIRIWFGPKVFVAIILDDLGYQVTAARRIAALPCRLTGAVLPFTPHAKAVANLLHAAGKEVFLHMPMQPSYRVKMVPEYSVMVKSGLTAEEVSERVERALESVPHAAGMNNHEGSVATESPYLMEAVMPVLKRHGLVFIDSGTTSRSTAWMAAKAEGIRWGKRNVFLDIVLDKAAVEMQLGKVIAIARRRGEAIAIGHPHAVTLEVLEEGIPAAIQEGVVFVGASTLTRGGK